MIKALISVDADLASSIALRYACQLANLTGMELQTIHVVEPEREGHTPGTGWVRRTWEDALLRSGETEITQLILAEKASCPTLGPPKMCIGDRDQEILGELQRESYDLFVEGVLYSFSAAKFYSKIRSRLYQYIPCPVILVKNLASLQGGILLLGEEGDLEESVDPFSKILGQVEADLDLLYCRFAKGKEPLLREESTRPGAEGGRAEQMLTEKGWNVRKVRLAEGPPEKLAAFVRDYGLVVCSIQRQKGKKGPLVELLSRTASPILICWR